MSINQAYDRLYSDKVSKFRFLGRFPTLLNPYWQRVLKLICVLQRNNYKLHVTNYFVSSSVVVKPLPFKANSSFFLKSVNKDTVPVYNIPFENH